jgi:hypothetical protein
MKYISLLIIPLLLLPLIMVTPTVARGTNEDDYKLGLKFGHDEYQKCDRSCLNLDLLGADCQTNQKVDNTTACRDGYAKAWIHEGGQTSVGRCIISGHVWDAGDCQSGRLVATTGPTVCHEESGKQICEAGIGQIANTNTTSLMSTQQAHAISDTELMKTNPYEYGYQQGVWDGQKSARDSTSACSPYNSTATVNECYHGYNSGFKIGCQEEGNRLPKDAFPEYGQC